MIRRQLCPDCLSRWSDHFDAAEQWIDCEDVPYRMPWRDWIMLRWMDLRKRWRRCPECTRFGYSGALPSGRPYRWVDDPVVKLCGFATAPVRCNTCGQLG